MRHSVATFLLLGAVAVAAAGCSQASGLYYSVTENSLSKPTNLFKVPSWAKLNQAGNDFHVMPQGPVPASDLISPDGHCAPAATPVQAAAPKPTQTAAPKPAQAAAPPADRLEPEGGFTPPAQAQAPVVGGVSLGMSECAVARNLGTPSNVSISRSPKGKRRVVLTYNGGDRPGLYSFLSGRLIQIDATPKQAKTYDKGVKKPRRTRGGAEHMYVQ